MDRRAISVETYEDVIRFEVRREGHIAGHDFPDLMQEMRFHVAQQCLPRIDTSLNTGRTYVRRSVRNALINLKRVATAQSKLPHDARGRPFMLSSLDQFKDTFDGDLPFADPTPDPERHADARELVQVLRNKLSRREMSMLRRAFVDGVLERGAPEKVEAARKKAEAILTHLLHRVEMGREETLTTMNDKRTDLPECHVHGTDPVGYETDLEDAEDCQNCVDKFTCLPDSIKTELIDGTIDIDPEVLAVHDGRMLIQVGRKRVSQRQDLVEKEEAIPDELRFDNVEAVAGKPATKKNDDNNDEENVTMDPNETEAVPKKKKKAKKKKAEAKAAAPAAPAKKKKKAASKSNGKAEAKAAAPKKKKKKKAEAKAAAPAKTKKKPKDAKKSKGKKSGKGKSPNAGGKNDKVLADGRLELGNGRIAPAPKKLDKEKMAKSLGRLLLGTPFDVEVGMQLIQKRRSGNDVIVKIKKDGYEWDGDVYGSLSAACMWATHRSVSGNDMFNFTKHSNITIKGKGVPNSSFRKGDAD